MNLCKDGKHGIALSENEIAVNMTRPDLFQDVDLYVNLAESISTIIDLMLIKNARINIVGVNKQAKFGLETSGMSTYDFITLENVVAKKGDSTSFFFLDLHLKNVLFTGFQKASCFYGKTLYTDLNSVVDSTFKFDYVEIDTAWKKQFKPNYKVDGAVFCSQVVFTNFLDGSSIYQYGDQVIITPINHSMGARRTNIRPIFTSVQYGIRHNRPGATLYMGSWFSNAVSCFENIEVNTSNSKVVVGGYKWSGNENIYFNSFFSVVQIDTLSPSVHFEEISDSIINASVKIRVTEVNTRLFRNVTFSGSSMIIGTLIVYNNDNFNSLMEKVVIDYIKAGFSTVNCTLSGSRYLISEIDKTISVITIEKLQLYGDVKIHITDRNPHHIVAHNVIYTNDISFHILYNETLNIGNKFYPLIYADNISSSLSTWIYDPIFPIPGYIEGNVFGFNGSSLSVERSFNICFSNTPGDKCGFPNAVTYNSIIPLSEIISNSYYPPEKLDDKGFNVYLSIPGVFNIDIGTPMMDYLQITSDCFATVMINNFSAAYNLDFVSVKIDSNINETTKPGLTKISMVFCNLYESITKYLRFDNMDLAEFDEISFNQFPESPRPFQLTIFTDKIVSNSTHIYPAVPTNQTKTRITFKGVNTVESHGKYPYYAPMAILPDVSIRFTSNSYGKLFFTMSTSDSQIVDVYYKAVLPVHLNDIGKFKLHPNFLGESISTEGKLCGSYVSIPLAEKEFLTMGDRSLMCGMSTVLDIPTEIQMISPYITGEVTLNKITVERQIYMGIGSSITVNEFSNPDDDFLFYFNWTLSKMPIMRIHRFIDSSSTSFYPSMQVYVYPSIDDTFFHSNEVFKFGIPFLCIYESEYKGYIFHDGLLFRLGNQSVNVTTSFYKIAQEKEGDTCVYMLPFKDVPRPEQRKGPANRKPWIITLISAIVFLGVLLTLLIRTYIKTSVDDEKSVLSANLI